MEKNSCAIVIVPGFWCSATGIYDQLTTKLQERGTEAVVAEYRSTGHGSADGITLYDDIEAVRSYIEPFVSKGREVVVAAHSAGGCVFQSESLPTSLTGTIGSLEAQQSKVSRERVGSRMGKQVE